MNLYVEETGHLQTHLFQGCLPFLLQSQAYTLGMDAQADVFSQPAVSGMCSKPPVMASSPEDIDKHIPSHAEITPTEKLKY